MTHNSIHLSWTVISGFDLIWHPNLKSIIHSIPSLEDITNPYLNLNLHKVHDIRGLTYTIGAANASYCAMNCLLYPGCDMFSILNSVCYMLPYISLKEESWTSYAIANPSSTLFVLQCSTIVENILTGSNFETMSTVPGNWTFANSKSIAYGSTINHLIMTSWSRLFVQEVSMLRTEITMENFPLGIDENYLTAFTMVTF